jgi:hypothetical protein
VIPWTPNWYTTCFSGWGEMASLAVNGVSVWTSGNCNPTVQLAQTLSIPANRTSTVVFVASSSGPAGSRSLLLAFINNSLDLPAGLEFVDDLDTASGDYSQ